MAQVIFCALIALLFWFDADNTDGFLRWLNIGLFALFVVQGCRAGYYAAQATWPEDDADA